MNYIFLKAKVYESDKVEDSQLLSIKCIKTDNKFNEIDAYENKIKLNDKSELILLNDIRQFCSNCKVIGYDLSKTLIGILSGMYRWKQYELRFFYFDIKDCGMKVENINTLKDMIDFMKEYSACDLDNVKYQRRDSKGCVLLKVFRGLDYNLYPINKGYIYDNSCNKYVSYYVHSKEINKDFDYTIDENLMLKECGGNFITNIFHISDDTIKYTNEYTIYSDNNLSEFEYMIEYMNNALTFLEQHKDLNIQLVCIGTIEELKENYKILGKEKIEKILKLIIREKKLWSKW